MKKIISILFLLFLQINAFAAQPTTKMVVLLDWFANPNHAPLFVAKEKGFFQQQGLDVTLIGPADPSDPPKLVAAGKADIAITYEPQFLEQVDQGLPLVRIGTLVDQPLDCLVVLKSSSIKTLADLKGKKIGSSIGGVSNVSLNTMLAKNDISAKEVSIINVHYALTQALLAKKVDAVTGMMRNFEPIQLELLGHPALLFYPEQNGVPAYSELILVANKNHINDPKLKKFLIALKEGTDYLNQHPVETWTLFAKNHPELNNELNRRAWFISLPLFTKNPENFNQQKWLDYAKFLQQHGLIKTIQPINVYAINLMKG